MKRKLPIFMFTICVLFYSQKSAAQNTVTVDGAAAWSGYANVFDNGTFQFGSAWTLADMKSVIDPISVTLYPNFNTYNSSDPYWSNGTIGNKTFEGNTFVENAALAGQALTFTAMVEGNSFSSGYTVIAFIKGLNPANNYNADVLVTTPLIAGQTFSITAPSIPTGLIVQYGFSVTGLNANPAQAEDLGNARVIPATLALNSFANSKFSVSPNPATDQITMKAAQNIDQIAIYNVLGQQMLAGNPQSSSWKVDISGFQSGLYIVKATVSGKTATSRIVKH